MNRNDYQNWLTNLVITLALVAFGYWLGQRQPCPKAAVMPVNNVTRDQKPTQQDLNTKYSK